MDRAHAADRAAESLNIGDEQAAIRRLVGASHESMLDLLASLHRAKEGKVKLRRNVKNAATMERTAHYTSISTRAALHRHLDYLRSSRVVRTLAPKYLKMRVWYIKEWAKYVWEAWGIKPWLLELADWRSLPSAVLGWYENVLQGFHDLIGERHGHSGTAGQAITHLRQFHLTVLRIDFPPFTCLANDSRLEGREVRKHTKSIEREARRGLVQPFLTYMCEDMRMTLFDTSRSRTARREAGAMWYHTTLACILILRLGETCTGPEYDVDRHWSVGQLIAAGWLVVLEGGAALTHSMPRKQDGNQQNNAYSFEKIPVLYSDHVCNPITAFRALIKFDATPADHAAGRIDDFGRPPTEEWASAFLQALGRRLFPLEAEHMDWTGHTCSIGAATAMQDAAIPHTLQSHAACKSLTSGVSEVYRKRTQLQLCRIQKMLLAREPTIMADTYGTFNTDGTVRSRPATAAAAESNALVSAGDLDQAQGIDALPALADFSLIDNTRPAAAAPSPKRAAGQTKLSFPSAAPSAATTTRHQTSLTHNGRPPQRVRAGDASAQQQPTARARGSAQNQAHQAASRKRDASFLANNPTGAGRPLAASRKSRPPTPEHVQLPNRRKQDHPHRFLHNPAAAPPPTPPWGSWTAGPAPMSPCGDLSRMAWINATFVSETSTAACVAATMPLISHSRTFSEAMNASSDRRRCRTISLLWAATRSRCASLLPIISPRMAAATYTYRAPRPLARSRAVLPSAHRASSGKSGCSTSCTTSG